MFHWLHPLVTTLRVNVYTRWIHQRQATSPSLQWHRHRWVLPGLQPNDGCDRWSQHMPWLQQKNSWGRKNHMQRTVLRLVGCQTSTNKAIQWNAWRVDPATEQVRNTTNNMWEQASASKPVHLTNRTWDQLCGRNTKAINQIAEGQKGKK